METEQVLIQRIGEGDQEAFAMLVKDLLPAAYKTAYLILRSKEHAEDALQMALESAYVSLRKKKKMPHFQAWFYRLVYSRSIDIYRRNKRFWQAEKLGLRAVPKGMHAEPQIGANLCFFHQYYRHFI